MRKKALTNKQRRFVEEYCKDLNIQQAYIRAGYEARYADPNAYRLFHNPSVQEAITKKMEDRADKYNVTIETVLAALLRIAEDAESEGQYTPALRAWENLGKYLGMFVDKSKTELDIKHVPDNPEEAIQDMDKYQKILERFQEKEEKGGIRYNAA